MFFVGSPAVYLGRHYSRCSAVYQGFSQISVIKDNTSVHGRYPGFVSPVFHPLPYALENPYWMEDLWRELLGVKRVGKAEDIGIEDEFRSYSCTKRISVDPHYAGKRPAVRIKGRR